MNVRFVLAAGLAVVITTGVAYAEGDPEQGKRAFSQCVACHSADPGQNRVGPSLHDIMGKQAASVEGFDYSPAMAEAGLTWDDETMAKFLENPRGLVPGTKMAFAGIRDEARIANLIAYLHELSAE